MARQQSNMELAGSLAATLTPRVPHASSQAPRGHQNSGLFDVGALYAETLGSVQRRVRSSPQLTPPARAVQPTWPLARTAQPSWPLATRWPQPVLSFDLEAEVAIEYAESSAAPRPRGLGWFGVAVAWLATVTTGAMIAISLPGDAVTHSRAASSLAAPVVVVPASPHGASPPVVVEASTPEASAAPTTAWSIPPVVAVPAQPAPPVAPRAVVSAVAPRAVVSAVAPKAVVAAVTPKAVVSAVAHPRPAPVAATTAPPAPAPAAAPRAPSASKPASATAPAAVSTAGMSLDDLIRHEVQAETAKHR
jgi:hypothetical protein